MIQLLIKMGDYLYNIDQVQERNHAGFNQGDYLGWPRVRGHAQQMAATLKKYLKTQLLPVFGEDARAAVEGTYAADEQMTVAVVSNITITPTFIVLDARYGASLVMQHEGAIPALIRAKYVAASKHLGLWWDRSLDRNYVPSVNLSKFDFSAYKAEITALGFVVNDIPNLAAAVTKLTSQPITLQKALDRLNSKQDRELFVCHKVNGKYCFRFSYSSALNNLLSNKTGQISGIVEVIAPGAEEVGIYGAWARVTDNLALAEEILQKATAIIPDWTIFTDDLAAERVALDQAQAKLTAPIAEVTKLLDPDFVPFPFQNEFIRFIDSTNGQCLIGAEMGLGKTFISLSWAAIRNKRILVVCPKVVRRTWIQEAKKFYPTVFNDKNTVELTPKNLKKFGLPDLTKVKVASVNFASLDKFKPAIEKAGFDLIIIDESHNIKSEKALITKTVRALGPLFAHKILLSGTAIKNKKDELYTQIDLIRPGFFTSKRDLKYATIGGTWHKIQEIYKTKAKHEVLKDLPTKTTQIIELEVVSCPDFTKKIPFEEIAAMKADVSLAKANATIEFIKEMLDSSESNMLVFSDSVDVVIKIHNAFPEESILHHGQLSDDVREAAKHEFQNGTKRILVSTRQSLAVGATLTKADKVIFNDLPWTPADISQAEDRTHRIGQTNPVNVYWIKAANNNWDDKVLGIIKKKYDIYRKILNGKQVSAEEKAWMEQPIKNII